MFQEFGHLPLLAHTEPSALESLLQAFTRAAEQPSGNSAIFHVNSNLKNLIFQISDLPANILPISRVRPPMSDLLPFLKEALPLPKELCCVVGELLRASYEPGQRVRVQAFPESAPTPSAASGLEPEGWDSDPEYAELLEPDHSEDSESDDAPQFRRAHSTPLPGSDTKASESGDIHMPTVEELKRTTPARWFLGEVISFHNECLLEVRYSAIEGVDRKHAAQAFRGDARSSGTQSSEEVGPEGTWTELIPIGSRRITKLGSSRTRRRHRQLHKLGLI